MPGHDIIVIGTSAGGVEALMKLAAALPAELDAAVFVVIHIPPYSTSALPRILDRCGPLPAEHARAGERIQRGRIYIAPPDRHLLLRGHRIELSRGPSENGTRPAVDPLFRSAATYYGPRVIGVVLSGTLDDGTAGLLAIKRLGGIAVAQDPQEALYPGMPRSAVEHVAVDYVRPVAEMGPLLAELAALPARETREEGVGVMSEETHNVNGADDGIETEIDEFNVEAMQTTAEHGPPSAFTCPECNGSLWEIHDGELIRYRCRVGHAYSPDTLLAEQSQALEAALWQAYRALKESAALSHRLADRARQRGHAMSLDRFARQADEAEQRAAVVRRALLRANIALEDAEGDEVPAD